MKKYQIGWKQAKKLFNIIPLSTSFAKTAKELSKEQKENKKIVIISIK